MSNNRVPLFFLSDCGFGGWRVYTAHLCRALRAVGLDPRIMKMGNRDEPGMRDFHYGEMYQNITRDSAYKLAGEVPSIIVVFDKNFISEMIGLHASGSYMMIHDEDEIIKTLYGKDYVYSALESMSPHRIMTNRKNGIWKKGAQCILHPYDTEGMVCQTITSGNVRQMRKQRYKCVSIARIDNDKRTEFLFDTNRLVTKEENKIQIFGYDGRVYGRKFLKLHYPEYNMSSYQFPRDSLYNGAKLCNDAEFSIDVSRITGEGAGGGTQYTFMESMHVGVPVFIHEDWLRPGGEMVHRENCFVVDSPSTMADILNGDDTVTDKEYIDVVRGGYRVLENHSPVKIGNQFKKELETWHASRS